MGTAKWELFRCCLVQLPESPLPYHGVNECEAAVRPFLGLLLLLLGSRRPALAPRCGLLSAHDNTYDVRYRTMYPRANMGRCPLKFAISISFVFRGQQSGSGVVLVIVVAAWCSSPKAHIPARDKSLATYDVSCFVLAPLAFVLLKQSSYD